MKKVILLGIAILFTGSTIMAAGLDIDSNTTIAAGMYDYLYISNNANANVNLAAGATVTVGGEVELVDDEGDVGPLTGLLTIGLGTRLNCVNGFAAGGGAGASASLNVEGRMSVSGIFTYDIRCEATALGSVDINVSGILTCDDLMFFGGYEATYASYTLEVSGYLSNTNTIYIGGYTGGVQGGGQAEVTYRGSATVNSKKTQIGWHEEGEAKGRLTLVGSGVNYDDEEIFLNAQGTLRYIADAIGVSCVEVYSGIGTRAWLEQDSVIELDMNALGAPSVGDSYDLIWCEEWTNLKWEDADDIDKFDAGVHLDSVSYAAGWRLQEIYRVGAGVLQVVYAPEPTTICLLGVGTLLGLLKKRRG